MGDIQGFLQIKRQSCDYRPVRERVGDYREVAFMRKDSISQDQASRCMDCGTPFCHWGCPIGNYIPEWNDLMFKGEWKKAIEILHALNPFPEITGRICPAICEYACVLGINDNAVTIRENELAIVEYAFEHGFIQPDPPKKRTEKKVAVVGSGPAGLAAATELNKQGHNIVVFERDDKIGGILRYGMPDFKLEKWIIDRRLEILQEEGVLFMTGINVKKGLVISKLKKEFDAICLACGSRVPRDLETKGRNLKGIHFAMDYLVQSNRRVFGEDIQGGKIIDAKGKDVVVIGGGDTGADCVGTACRQGAKTVTQIEVLSKPPKDRPQEAAWPKYPLLLKNSSSHEEGCKRYWSVITEEFTGEGGRVKGLSCVQDGKRLQLDADLVIIAIGFLHPEKKGLVNELGLELDKRGNVKTDQNYMTSKKGIFSAGDMRRGQSLVVWAISEGLECAKSINNYLKK